MYRSAARLASCAALLALASGCAGAGDSEPAQQVGALSAPPVVDFEATDFAFSGPDTIAPGITTLRLTNAGQAFHHLTVVKLAEGHDLAEFTAAMSEGSGSPEWSSFLGGPNPAAAGQTIDATLDLTPGNYAVICVIPAGDKMHFEMGMIGGFVVAGESPEVDYQAPSLTMTLNDYGFEWSEPPTAGSHRLRVVNSGPQAHEVVILKLNEGATQEDVLEWMHALEQGTAGPPPFSLNGGVATMDPGVSNDITLNLEPGSYALMCFVPDSGDGNPHFLHGMMDVITIN